MRIEQLEYFNAVTRYGSLRRASEHLHLSQPALSESIRNLEKELGVSLLDRRRSGSRISRQGQDLLPRLNGVLEAVAQLRAAAEGHGTSRVVRVGTVNAGTSALLVPAIRRLAADHPGATVDVANVLQRDVHTGLVEGGLDVGLVNVLPGDDVPAGLHATALLHGRPVLVCRSDDPLAQLAEVDPAVLRDRPFVAMREGYLMHRFAHRVFDGAFPRETCSTDGAENGKFLVASGMGVTILPDYSVTGDPLEVAGAITSRPLAGVTTPVRMLLLRREGRATTFVRAFEQTLVDLAHQHPQGRSAVA